MKIDRVIYEKLLALPFVPPETGGILGSQEGCIIAMEIDLEGSGKSGYYSPSSRFINRVIEKWIERGISFEGMFHTHAPNWTGLSAADRTYILTIMDALFSLNGALYFPVVHPGQSIEVFRAEKNGNEVRITKDRADITVFGRE